MEPNDDERPKGGRGRSMPQQTSVPGQNNGQQHAAGGGAIHRSSSGYGTGEKPQSFGTASIVNISSFLKKY
jgi:hypothetical protein